MKPETSNRFSGLIAEKMMAVVMLVCPPHRFSHVWLVCEHHMCRFTPVVSISFVASRCGRKVFVSCLCAYIG